MARLIGEYETEKEWKEREHAEYRLQEIESTEYLLEQEYIEQLLEEQNSLEPILNLLPIKTHTELENTGDV